MQTKKVIFSLSVVFAFWLASLSPAVAHDQSEHLKAANQSRFKGNEIPGAINLGLSGKAGSYAATYLEGELGKQLSKGLYQQSGAYHFGNEPREDVKLLAAAEGETVGLGSRCPKDAPVRSYDVSAINVVITLNQYHDFYPGYMYVLTENIEIDRP